MLIIFNIFLSNVSFQKDTLRSFFDFMHEFICSFLSIGIEGSLELVSFQILYNVESTVLSSSLNIVEFIRECRGISIVLGKVNKTFIESETDHSLSSELIILIQEFIIGGDLSKQCFRTSVSSGNWRLHDTFKDI